MLLKLNSQPQKHQNQKHNSKKIANNVYSAKINLLLFQKTSDTCNRRIASLLHNSIFVQISKAWLNIYNKKLKLVSYVLHAKIKMQKILIQGRLFENIWLIKVILLWKLMKTMMNIWNIMISLANLNKFFKAKKIK